MKTMIINKSIERVFRIIELLAYSKDEEYLTLDDISKASSLNISTTYRYLKDLMHIGLIEKNEQNKHYRLTLELYKIGNSILYNRSGNVVSYAIQSIKQFSKQYNEIINLYAFEKNQVICIFRADNFGHPVSYSIKIGSQHPAYCTAAGKVFLSNKNKDDIDSYFKEIKMQRYTQNTQIDVDKIIKELILTKKNGYALDKEEYIAGANCIAVPIKTNNDNVYYSISIVLPQNKLESYNFPKLVDDLKKTAENISNRITN